MGVEEQAWAAWQALQAAAAEDERLRVVLGQLAVAPAAGERALRAWLTQLSDDDGDAPAQIATYVSGGHVEKLVNIASAQAVHLTSVVARPAPTSLFGLPRDVADFTGRQAEVDELTALLGAADRGSTAVVISALAGMAGVGKSALAIHVAHRLRDRYPDAQLYVNLRGVEAQRLDPASVLADFLAALGLTGDEIPQGIDQRAAVYRAQLADRRALIVLDNVHDEAQVRSLLPGSPSCAVIITSRAPLGGLDGVRLRTLDVFDHGAAVELLGKLAGPKRIGAEPQQATRIVELCGHLALAVRIAGGLLAEQPAWTLAKVAQRLSDKQRRLEELQLADLAVRTSFALSYDMLDADAQRVFRRLSALAGPDFGSGVVAALDDSDPDAIERLLERLADAQLLETPTEDRYRLHDLIALFAGERANDQEPVDALQHATTRGRGWYLQQAQLANAALGTASSELTLGDLDVDSARGWALGWMALERANLVATIEQAHGAEDWQSTHQLANSLTSFLSLRAHWDDWQHTHELALDATRHAKDRHGEAQTLGNLGLVYADQGRWEDAITCYEQSLQTMRELGDHHGEAQTLNNLGAVYADQGRWEDAITCYEQSLQTKRELGDHHGEAQTLNNLGTVYDRQGRWEDAITCYEQSLQTKRELGDRHGEAQTLNNLGTVYDRQGRWEDAITCYEQSLQTKRELGDRHGEAQTLGNLGSIHANQGRREDAITCYEQDLSVSRELGDRHGEAQTLNNLGLIYANQGRWEDAITCYEQSLQTKRELGDRHGEAQTLGNLGSIHANQGRWEDAITCYEQSLQTKRELGDRHGEAQTLGNLGSIHANQGRWEDAIACYEQSLQTKRELGDRHGEAHTLNSLGLALRARGDEDGARHHLGNALVLFDALGAPEAERVRALLDTEPRRWWKRRRRATSS